MAVVHLPSGQPIADAKTPDGSQHFLLRPFAPLPTRLFLTQLCEEFDEPEH